MTTPYTLTFNAMPKYNLDEILEIRTAGMNMNVIITKRIVIVNFDNLDVFTFIYEFKHTANIKNAWSWDNVPEESLDDLIYEAKKFNKMKG